MVAAWQAQALFILRRLSPRWSVYHEAAIQVAPAVGLHFRHRVEINASNGMYHNRSGVFPSQTRP